jgi:hypothetical protein
MKWNPGNFLRTDRQAIILLDNAAAAHTEFRATELDRCGSVEAVISEACTAAERLL